MNMKRNCDANDAEKSFFFKLINTKMHKLSGTAD
jgi:hypothetical protein